MQPFLYYKTNGPRQLTDNGKAYTYYPLISLNRLPRRHLQTRKGFSDVE